MPPTNWGERVAWRHERERRVVQEVVSLTDRASGSANLLDASGDYNGDTVRMPGPANRARLALSCDDDDVLAWLQRNSADGWADVYSLTAGAERTVALSTQQQVRVRIDAASGAVCTSYRLDLRRI